MRKRVVFGVCLVVLGAGASARQGAAGQVTAQGAGAPQGRGTPAPLPALVVEVQNIFNPIKTNITKAVDQFPEDKLTWAPTDKVRSWARLIGHLSDDNNGACYLLAGETTRPARLETEDTPNSAANKMSKADLQKALAESFARCDKAFAAVTPENMAERLGQTSRSKIGGLIYNTQHINEHYGNIVTYMRLQNLVPPSSAGRGGL
jgi:hypothetical protein